MPWETLWIPENPAVPPDMPREVRGGYWTELWVEPPGRSHAEKVEAAQDAAAALDRLTEPRQIAHFIQSRPELWTWDSWREAVERTWRGLVQRGAAGSASHDLLKLEIAGKGTRLTFTEISRTPAWLAPNGGFYRTSHPIDGMGSLEYSPLDVWIDADGVVWPPWTPHAQGGGLLCLQRDVKGRVFQPNPLSVIVPRGQAMWTERRMPKAFVWDIVMMAGVTVTARDDRKSGFEISSRLDHAVVAAVLDGEASVEVER